MYTSSSDPAQRSLRIRQDDKFYSKLLSKENSVANPSFRVYYGGASGAVPFEWESQPGTPKHPSQATALPPLTPPPSYQFSPRRSSGGQKGSSSKSNLLNALLPRLTPRKSLAPSSPPVSFSSSSVSSSASSTFSPMASSSTYHGRSWFSSPRSPFSSMGDDDESDAGSRTSTLCFGTRHGGFRGCYKMVIVKNALLSIVGHGSGQGTA